MINGVREKKKHLQERKSLCCELIAHDNIAEANRPRRAGFAVRDGNAIRLRKSKATETIHSPFKRRMEKDGFIIPMLRRAEAPLGRVSRKFVNV